MEIFIEQVERVIHFDVANACFIKEQLISLAYFDDSELTWMNGGIDRWMDRKMDAIDWNLVTGSDWYFAKHSFIQHNQQNKNKQYSPTVKTSLKNQWKQNRHQLNF